MSADVDIDFADRQQIIDLIQVYSCKTKMQKVRKAQ